MARKTGKKYFALTRATGKRHVDGACEPNDLFCSRRIGMEDRWILEKRREEREAKEEERLPINKKRRRCGVFHADRIDYRSGPGLDTRLPFSSLSTLLFLLFSFPLLEGLSFVKLDSLAPSLRAITLDYFCLQSRTPRLTVSYTHLTLPTKA